MGNRRTAAMSHGLHGNIFIGGCRITVVYPQERADFHLLSRFCQNGHAVAGHDVDFSRTQVLVIFVSQIQIREFLKAGAVSGFLLSDGQRRTSQLIPHAENAPLSHDQHAHGSFNHVLRMADAVNHILFLVNQGCHQFRGVDVSIPHLHELGRSVVEQLLQQFRLIADLSNGGDGKGSVVGTHRQRLRFIIRNGSHAHVALHARYIGIEFRSKRSIFNIMNCPIKSILSVHYQSATSGSQMRVIIRSEKQIKHTIFFQRRCKKTAHAKPLSCRFICSASKI